MDIQHLSPNLCKLIETANEIHAYIETVPYGASTQKAQAKAILHEIRQTIKKQDEFLILKIFEASIIPKLIKLAKDIAMYKAFTTEHKKPTPHKIPDVIVMNAYETYDNSPRNVSYDTLSEDEKTKIDNLFADLYQQLAEKKNNLKT